MPGGDKNEKSIALDTPSQAADYISRMTRELTEIARRHELGFLSYLLNMAHEESVAEANRIKADVD